MTLLDLQDLDWTTEKAAGGGGGSKFSVSGCPGKSSLSVTLCK
jgi:hypothetical protein